MQARTLLFKIAIFGLLNTVILLAVLMFFSGRNRDIQLAIADTESNLLVSGENQHYDVALLGTSRGRVFSRDGNHQLVETLLGKRLINLSKGGGGGLMPAKLHLSYFYSRGNSVGHIFYLVDPWVFFSAINNENNSFFLRDEPFEISILWQLLIDHYPMDRVFSYLQMIGVNDWQAISRYAGPGLTEGTLKKIEEPKLKKAREYYRNRYGEDSFARYSQFVDKIDILAAENGSKITYIMLPLLIADFPGIAEVDRKLRDAAAGNENVNYHNLATDMQNRLLFYDHMHFNKKGIAFFTEQVIAPILGGQKPYQIQNFL